MNPRAREATFPAPFFAECFAPRRELFQVSRKLKRRAADGREEGILQGARGEDPVLLAGVLPDHFLNGLGDLVEELTGGEPVREGEVASLGHLGAGSSYRIERQRHRREIPEVVG